MILEGSLCNIPHVYALYFPICWLKQRFTKNFFEKTIARANASRQSTDPCYQAIRPASVMLHHFPSIVTSLWTSDPAHRPAIIGKNKSMFLFRILCFMSFFKRFVLICHILYVGMTICIFTIFHSGIRIFLNQTGFLNGALNLFSDWLALLFVIQKPTCLLWRWKQLISPFPWKCFFYV